MTAVLTAPDRTRGLEAALIERCWKDEQFRQQLIANPRGAISSALGVDLPPDVEIEVLEESPSKLFLVIPAPPEHVSDAPYLEQLEADACASFTIGNGDCSCSNSCGGMF